MPGHMFLLFSYTVSAYFATFRLYGQSRLYVYLAWPAVVIVTSVFEMISYTLSARVHEISNKLLFSARRVSMSEELKREFKALRPMHVYVGVFFTFQRTTFLNFYHTVIDYAFACLLI